MSENGIEGLRISNPLDLERTAQEIAQLTRSPEVARLLKAQKKAAESQKPSVKSKKSDRPVLRVIENADWGGDTSQV
jgi:hypothetical protein